MRSSTVRPSSPVEVGPTRRFPGGSTSRRSSPASHALRDSGNEELFGPIVTVVSFDNERDAVRLANDSIYSLGASVWTADRGAGPRGGVAQIRAGSVWVNDHAYSYGACQAPWGGRGASGLGRTHGRQALEAMSHTKFTDADRGRLTPGWWYPYSEQVVDGFRGILGGLHGGDGLAARAGALVEHRRGLVHLARKMLR